MGMESNWDLKVLYGTVPVNPDGSAIFTAPACQPLTLQVLDGEGRALALMRSWFTAMPGETLSCIGCHERQNCAPRQGRHGFPPETRSYCSVVRSGAHFLLHE